MHPEREKNLLRDQLKQALGNGNLPPEYAEWGSQLLTRLDNPVQVVVIGQPGSGKSTVIDMMLGKPVISRHPGNPIIEVCYGPEENVTSEFRDGRTTQQQGLVATGTPPAETVRIRQELPDPQLLRHSFVEISLTGPQEQQQFILQRAARHADVILWCSELFGPDEQTLWSAVPDEKKDHSFLILTMADRQIMRGTLAELIAGLEEVAAEEFLGLYPLAAVQATTAQTAGQVLNADLWKSSGGQQLCRDVLQQIELGQASDVDQAEMLIRQFSATPEGDASRSPKEPQQPVAEPTPIASNTQPSDDLLHTALDLLQGRAKQMLAQSSGGTDPDTDSILANCMQTVRQMSTAFSGAATPSAAVQAALDASEESEELLMLFQLERGEDAAVDAVTLLLQLKREISDEIAS